MNKTAKFFLRLSIFLQFATAGLHSLSFIAEPVYANDTERQLDELMATYKFDMGAGFHRTTMQIFNSISICFELMFIFGALITWFLLSAKAGTHIFKGIITIQTIIFGIATIAIALLAFLPPLVCTGLVFLVLLLARISLKKEISVQ